MTPEEKRAAVVAAMASEIGPGDTPKYWADVGVNPPPKPNTPTGHWCGAMALWALHQAGIAVGTRWKIGLGFISPLGLPQTKSPKPGDILYKDAPFQHHGVVESFEEGTVVSIEGNTPTVKRVTRTSLTGLTFYSIEKLLGGASAPAPPAKPPPIPPKPAPKPPPAAAEPTGILGIDVSSHQTPAAINYAQLAKTHKFVIARAAYGTKPDARFQDHIARAKAVGLTVGAYLFFRPQLDSAAQAEVFGEACEKAGIGHSWLVPALDIEQNVANDGPVTRARYDDPCHAIVDLWTAKYGSALVYTTISMWAELGNPEWLRDCPLWAAHYGVNEPRTPFGMQWAIWQHTGSGHLYDVHAAILDLNVARWLPLIGSDARDTDPGDPALLPLTVDWEEQNAARDRDIKGDD